MLAENWDAAQVFLRLHLDRQIDQGMTVYTGVPAGEIRQWMALLRVPAAQRRDTADGVLVMVRAACQELNERNAARYRAQTRSRR